MKQAILTTVIAIGLFGAQAWAGCGACGTEAKHHNDKTEGDACKANGACKADLGQAKETAHGTHGKDEGHATIDTQVLEVLLAGSKDVVILDARSGKYDDGRRIPGAAALNAGSTAEEISSVIPTKETLVVTYCSNLKCPASAQLASALRKLGYSNILEYPVGIEGWVEAGNEIERAN